MALTRRFFLTMAAIFLIFSFHQVQAAANPNASEDAQKVLNWLDSLSDRENNKVRKFKTLSKGKDKKEVRKLEEKMLKPEPIPKYFGRKAGIGPVEKRSILFIFPSRKDLNRLGKFVKINTAKGNNTQDINFLISILELLESGSLTYDEENKTISITKTKKRRRRRKK